MLDRRSLLTKAAAGTAGAVALAALRGYGTASAASMTLDKLTLANFSPLVGQSMQMYPASGAPFAVKLIKAEGLGKATTKTTIVSNPSSQASQQRGGSRSGPSTPPITTTTTTTTPARPFSVLFQGPVSPNLPDHVYGIDHPQLGRLDFYVTRIGPSKATPVYEAIFG